MLELAALHRDRGAGEVAGDRVRFGGGDGEGGFGGAVCLRERQENPHELPFLILSTLIMSHHFGWNSPL